MTRLETLLFISKLDGWLSSHEGYFLYEAARQGKGKGEIVEIGSWMGKSTICLAAGSLSAKREKVTAIDPHKGEFSKGNGIGKKAPTYKKFQDNLKKAGILQYVVPQVTTSEEAVKKWKKSIRLLFIDGLHDYEHTKQDFSLWSPFVKDGGMIAFHDAFCGHEGPEKVIQELLKSDDYADYGVVGSIIYVHKKRIKTISDTVNLLRHRIFIPLALFINKANGNKRISFFLIHRVIKLFLLNSYTISLIFRHEKI